MFDILSQWSDWIWAFISAISSNRIQWMAHGGKSRAGNLSTISIISFQWRRWQIHQKKRTELKKFGSSLWCLHSIEFVNDSKPFATTLSSRANCLWPKPRGKRHWLSASKESSSFFRKSIQNTSLMEILKKELCWRHCDAQPGCLFDRILPFNSTLSIDSMQDFNRACSILCYIYIDIDIYMYVNVYISLLTEDFFSMGFFFSPISFCSNFRSPSSRFQSTSSVEAVLFLSFCWKDSMASIDTSLWFDLYVHLNQLNDPG